MKFESYIFLHFQSFMYESYFEHFRFGSDVGFLSLDLWTTITVVSKESYGMIARSLLKN